MVNAESPQAPPATGEPVRRPPRILFISDIYLPQVGGSITWFHNVYTRFYPGSVTILTKSYPDDAQFDAQHPGIDIRRRSLKRYWFMRPHSLVMYWKLLLWTLWLGWRQKIDVIHAGKNLPEAFIARWAARILRKPYVVYAHGEEITLSCQHSLHQATLKPVYGDAAAVIVNSNFTQQLLRENGICGTHLRRISPGVNVDQFQPGPRDPDLVARFGLVGKIVLLSVGRLTKRKGHDNVVRALPRVLEQIPNLVYIIASDGEEREYLERLVEETGVSESVIFAGQLPYSDLPRLYNTCDIFVMANRQLENGDLEGFGIVFLEASGCGKPVIGGASGGTADAIRDGETGIRINGSSVAEIERAIVALAGDPELCAAMGRAGRAMVCEEYTWDQVAAKIQVLTQEVVEGRVGSTEAAHEAGSL